MKLNYKEFSERHRPHIHPPGPRCNSILFRRGQFWEHESFDHVIRAGKFSATIMYVLNNPVKAGLVKHWKDWRWNYCRSDIADKL